jgi:hypothetical protein
MLTSYLLAFFLNFATIVSGGAQHSSATTHNVPSSVTRLFDAGGLPI